MSNLFRSLSSFIGVRADGPAAQSKTASSIAPAAAPAPQAEPASSGDVLEHHASSLVQAPQGSTLDLPLVAYVPPRGDEPSAQSPRLYEGPIEAR